MKQIKKFFPVLLAVILLAAVSVVPAFAQGEIPAGSEPIEFNWAEISNALQTLLTAFLVPAAGFAARWMFAKGSFEYNKLNEAQKEQFKLALNVWVYAAEQMNLKGLLADKMQFVLSMAEHWLAAKRLDMNLDEVRYEVESIVAKEFNMGKILTPKSSAPRVNG